MPRLTSSSPDPRGFLPLSPQVFQILLSLHDDAQHGYAIIQDVRMRTNGTVRLTASTLYDALARLVDQSILSELDASARAPDTDSRRRYYALTALGRQVVKAEVQRLEGLIRMAHDVGVTRRGTSR